MKCNSSGLSIVFNILAPLHSLMLLLILFSLDLLFNPALTYWNIFFFMNMLYFFYDLFNKHLRGFPYGGFALKETVPELYCSKAATRTGRFTLIKASTSLSAQLPYEFRFSLFFFFLKAQQTVFSSNYIGTHEKDKNNASNSQHCISLHCRDGKCVRNGITKGILCPATVKKNHQNLVKSNETSALYSTHLPDIEN